MSDLRKQPTLEEATLTDTEFLQRFGHHKTRPCKRGCGTHVDSADGYCRHCRWLAFGLYVNDRMKRPFHCNRCGDTFEACRHWEEPKV